MSAGVILLPLGLDEAVDAPVMGRDDSLPLWFNVGLSVQSPEPTALSLLPIMEVESETPSKPWDDIHGLRSPRARSLSLLTLKNETPCDLGRWAPVDAYIGVSSSVSEATESAASPSRFRT